MFALLTVLGHIFRVQSGITVTEELLDVYGDVKLRHMHKFIIFSLKKVDAAGKTYTWSIDHKADPVPDIAANKVRAHSCFNIFVS